MFEGRSEEEKKTAIMNAFIIMTADGHVDEKEKALLAAICHRHGVGPIELQEIIRNAGNIQFTVPTNPEERVFQLLDIVLMMLVDGKIDQRELNLCTAMARKLGFAPGAVPELIKALIEGATKGRNREQIKIDVASYLGS